MNTVRLETETGHFVVAGRTPPFQTLPTVIKWGERIFALYEAGAHGFPSRYRERFTVALVDTDTSGLDPCPQREPPTFVTTVQPGATTIGSGANAGGGIPIGNTAEASSFATTSGVRQASDPSDPTR